MSQGDDYERVSAAMLIHEIAAEITQGIARAISNHGPDPKIEVIIATGIHTALKEMKTTTPLAVQVLIETIKLGKLDV